MGQGHLPYKVFFRFTCVALNIGSVLGILRRAKGVKLKDIAIAAEVSTPFLTLVEKGDREPSLAVLRRIAKALDVPTEVVILLSQPVDSAIDSSDARIQRLVESIERVADAERTLRKQLATDAEQEDQTS